VTVLAVASTWRCSAKARTRVLIHEIGFDQGGPGRRQISGIQVHQPGTIGADAEFRRGYGSGERRRQQQRHQDSHAKHAEVR
jgi:hypothetical protein